jgi:hypothetical protein
VVGAAVTTWRGLWAPEGAFALSDGAGGNLICARDLGITPQYVNMLLRFGYVAQQGEVGTARRKHLPIVGIIVAGSDSRCCIQLGLKQSFA